MKKIVNTILASALMLSLCACNSVSREEYEALNSRVEALEQSAGTITTEALSETTFDISIENTEISNSDEITTSIANSTNYTLEGMTAEEIYAECQKIFQTMPQTEGMTVSEYYSCLDYAPNTTGPCELTFPDWAFDGYEDSNIMNCIRVIGVRGPIEQMDGTIIWSVPNNNSTYACISIGLCFDDYETASAVYNLVITDSKYTNVVNNQTGTNWSAYATTPSGSSYPYADCEIAYLSKQSRNGYDYYELTINDWSV